MPMIAAPVAAWALGVGASAGVAAVAGAVAVGVVSGAVVGAATAAITGGNIFKGALRGAAIGGVTAGVFSGLGIATGLATAESQLAAYGVEGYGATAVSGSASPAINTPTTEVAFQSAVTTPAAPSAAAPSSSMFSDETVKVLAGVGQGVAEGAGEVAAAKTEAKSARELAEWNAQQERITKAENLPGEFEAKTANIQVPEWWNNYLNPQKGILETGVA